jgi:hypothetical protein
MPKTRKGYWGFALVEFEKMEGGETPEQKLHAFKQLQRDIVGKKGKVKATFGSEVVKWPESARIQDVKKIKRLYGFQTVPVFSLYIRVKAKDEFDLGQAFRFLDRHCHVEGYM